MADENVTTKFKVDISDLRKNISDANRLVREYRAELKNASAGMQDSGDTADTLTKKIEAQKEIVEAEKKKLEALKEELGRYQQRIRDGDSIIQELTDKHKAAADAFGKDSEEAQKLAEQLKKAQEAQERNETAADNLRVQIVNQDTAVKNAEGSVRNFTEQLDALQTEEKDVGDEAQKTTDGGLDAFSVALGNMVSGIISEAIDKLKELAQSAYDAYNAFDEGRDNLIKSTGATGDAADQLTDVYKNVSKQVSGDLGEIGSAVGEVNTRFGYTGEELEKASVAFLKFSDITGTNATRAVQLVSRAMGDAGVDADDYADVMDKLASASQASGIKLEKLAQYITQYGAPMRALGFDMEESIALFSQWEKSGVNTETAFAGMKTAISSWSKEGKNAKDEFKKTLKEIANAPDIAKATTRAIEVFGKKAGPDLADAIQGGRFEYEEFLNIVQGSAGTVDSTFEETQSVMDETKITLQELKVTAAEGFAVLLEEIAPEIEELLPLVSEFVRDAIPELKEFLQWVKDNGPEIASTIAGIATAFLVFKTVTFIQTAITALQTLAAVIEVVGVKQAALNLIMSANPIALVIAAVAGLIASMITLYNTNEDFRNFCDGMWEEIDKTMQEYYQNWELGAQDISDWFQEFSDDWKQGASDIADGWNAFWADWKRGWDDIKENWTGFWDNWKLGLGVIRDAINGIIRLLNKIPGVEIPEIGSVPQMARGGIVNRPTLAQIGEAGAEAVIPLENNTQGLREIANLLRREMDGSGGTGGTVQFTQNISSPKPLSEYEIWRQTRNLLDIVKKKK